MPDPTPPSGSPPFAVPAMYFDDSSRLGRPLAKDPTVVRFRDSYWMYYSIPPFAPERASPDSAPGWGIGIARSADLIHWEKAGELLPAPGTVEANGICAPGARVLNGEIHLFYQTYGNGALDAICHAVSGDGLHFERDPSNPVFRPSGHWTSGRAIDASVFPFGGRLYLYYATRDPQMKVQMLGVASADLGSDFGRDSWTQLSDSGPILKPELPWEQDCIEAPDICEHGGLLYMFYAGAYNNAPQQIGVATSTDGVCWQRLQDTPILPCGAPGSWNESESGHPAVFVDSDSQTYLFFQGNRDRGATWYLSCARIRWSESGVPVPEV